MFFKTGENIKKETYFSHIKGHKLLYFTDSWELARQIQVSLGYGIDHFYKICIHYEHISLVDCTFSVFGLLRHRLLHMRKKCVQKWYSSLHWSKLFKQLSWQALSFTRVCLVFYIPKLYNGGTSLVSAKSSHNFDVSTRRPQKGWE